MPKSMIRAWSCASIMMFAGFRSRCTTPAACAARDPTPRPGHPQSASDRQRSFALDHRREVHALTYRHRDVLDAVDVAEVVDAHDVAVRDLSREQQLALEPALDIARRPRIAGDFRPNNLQRDSHAQLFVPRLVDDAHAAGAELTLDSVARTEGHIHLQRTGTAGGRVAAGDVDAGGFRIADRGRVADRGVVADCRRIVSRRRCHRRDRRRPGRWRRNRAIACAAAAARRRGLGAAMGTDHGAAGSLLLDWNGGARRIAGRTGTGGRDYTLECGRRPPRRAWRRRGSQGRVKNGDKSRLTSDA